MRRAQDVRVARARACLQNGCHGRPARSARRLGGWKEGAVAAVFIGVALSGIESQADLVTDWNSVFLSAVRNETTAPPQASRNLAIFHTSIYDAVNAISRTYQPYHFDPGARIEASMEAAIASAAREVAVNLYPSQSSVFDSFYAQSIASIPAGPMRDNGLALGVSAANSILNWRSADGSSTLVPYIPSSDPGAWRRTPPFFRPPESPQWQYVTPFAMTNTSQFRPSGPPSLTSAQYAADFNQVKSLGALNSATRTAEQTEVAYFWSDFSYTVTPPGHWNEVARNVATDQASSLEENAHTFALLNIAMADAAIAAWDAKYEYNFWRPVTAIQEADGDGNPDTVSDPDWRPLLVAPAFPEYISGHSTFSAAAAAVLAHAFGSDEITFTVGSDGLPGVFRTYDSFWETAEEIGLSRIYGGIHFLSADLDGLATGQALGEYVVDVYLLPIPEPSTVALGILGAVMLFAVRVRRRPRRRAAL